MAFFTELREILTAVKEWEIVAVLFSLPILWFVVCCPLKSKRVYSTFTEVMLLLAFFLLSVTYSLTEGLLLCVLALAECRLLYRLIPREVREKKEVPKVVCYPEPPPKIEIATHSIEETNLCLDHAFEVVDSLKCLALEGSDRLEVDNVELTLKLYRQKGLLTDREMRSLNDCLALLLKLTAKYDLVI